MFLFSLISYFYKKLTVIITFQSYRHYRSLMKWIILNDGGDDGIKMKIIQNFIGVIRRKIFVLDLDETLIHSHHDGIFRPMVKPGTPPDFILRVGNFTWKRVVREDYFYLILVNCAVQKFYRKKFCILKNFFGWN